MENKIGFKLLGLKTEQFALFEENFSTNKKSELATNLEFKVNIEKCQVGVFSTFTFEQSKKPFIKLQVSCHFAIAPNAWENCIKTNTIVFPKGFMEHLTVITVGSARGILHSKTEGTEFNKFILPTIDVTKLVTQDIEFNYV